MKPALFVSDLHLAASRPATAAAFHAWTRGPARDACAVYVLGDLFDEWIGDEQADDPFTREVVASLRGIADAGVPVAARREHEQARRTMTLTACPMGLAGRP